MTSHQSTALFKVEKMRKSKAKSCLNCRAKKRKCTQETPACSNCAKKKQQCKYGTGDSLDRDEAAKLLLEINSKNMEITQSRHSGGTVFSNSEQSMSRAETLVSSGAEESFSTDRIRKTADVLNDVKETTGKLLQKGSRPLKDIATGNTDTTNHLSNGTVNVLNHPTCRVGPVFTTLFNSSVNLIERGVVENIQQLNSYVPTKGDADVLIARYRTSVHPLIPILDLQQFYPIYEQFWADGSIGTINFFMTLFTIFYASSVSLFEEQSVKHNADLEKADLVKQMKYYMGCVEISLAMAEYPRKVSLAGLQTSVILYTIVRTDCKTDDFLSISSLVRCAQLMELNKDPMSWHNISNVKEIQMRRILWWQVLYLDCTTSLSTRLSPLVDEVEYDTQLPIEYTKHSNGEFILDQSIAFFNGRCQWAKCCNKILKLSFRIKPAPDTLISKIDRDIEHLSFFCSSSIQRMLDPINIKPSEEKFVKFCTLVLSTMVDRCRILMSILFKCTEKRPAISNTPLMSHSVVVKPSTLTSSISDTGRPMLDDEVLDSHIHLLNEFMKYGEMPHFSIFLWEIRKFQPIQTLFSLLRYVISRVAETGNKHKGNKAEMHKAIENIKNHGSSQIIENSISKLSYLSEHTTELCRQRWNVLFDLQSIAWQLMFKTNEEMMQRNVTLQPHMPVVDVDTPPLSEPDERWEEIYQEMNDIQVMIDNNINMNVWDEVSGHFLL
jgi:hypothetical protein